MIGCNKAEAASGDLVDALLGQIVGGVAREFARLGGVPER